MQDMIEPIQPIQFVKRQMQMPAAVPPVPTKEGAPKSYFLWTNGCQMNKADSERLGSAFEQLGLGQSQNPREADVIVFNSCVVRKSAEDKVVSAMGLVKPLKQEFPGKLIALMGCMVGPNMTKQLKQRFPYVDVFVRPQEYKPLLDIVGDRMGVDWEGCVGSLAAMHPDIANYVPIIHGCDEFCSYCVIPYRRGRQVSRPVDELVWEVEHLVARGVKEVTLLGQTVDAYGMDLPEKPDLADLFTSLHDIPGLLRIRFLTSHPNYMSERILHAIADLPKVCEHVNLPVQAGDNTTLKSMRRTYTREDYLMRVEQIRRIVPNAAMSTDIIVGFCGETDEQFRNTERLMEEVRFDKVHLARYSPRPNTIAMRKMEDDVPKQVKEERFQILERVQARISVERNSSYKGRTLGVLVDGHETGKWKGRSDTDKLVFIEGAQSDLMGQMVNVEITDPGTWSLRGRLAGSPS